MSVAFRLFDPADFESPGKLKLRQAYQQFHLPELEEIAENTLSEYETQLRHWEQRSGDPPIEEVSDATLKQVKTSLLTEGYAPATVGKLWRTLRPIFRTLLRAGVIDKIPRVKLPRVTLSEPRVAAYRELSALYEACGGIRLHRGPATGWRATAEFRCALVLFYNVGLRSEDLWGLTWSMIDLERGGLTIKIQKTKRTIVRPLNKTVLAHLRELHDGRGGKVFKMGRSTVMRHWKRIRERAAAASGIDLADLTFHDFRRTCQTRLDEIKLGLGDWMLDHRTRDVGSMYYRNLFRLGAKAVKKLRQPKAFRALKRDPQKRLFAEEQNGTDIREDTTEGGTEAGREGQA